MVRRFARRRHRAFVADSPHFEGLVVESVIAIWLDKRRAE